jgi:hypothetical protein
MAAFPPRRLRTHACGARSRENAVEFQQVARQQIMYMAGLRASRSKLVNGSIGIALDNR